MRTFNAGEAKTILKHERDTPNYSVYISDDGTAAVQMHVKKGFVTGDPEMETFMVVKWAPHTMAQVRDSFGGPAVLEVFKEWTHRNTATIGNLQFEVAELKRRLDKAEGNINILYKAADKLIRKLRRL